MKLIKLFKSKGHILTKIELVIYLASFLGAFYNHASDLVNCGLFPYSRLNPDVAVWLNIYWTMLTILDPAAIIILFFNIKAGLWCYLAIIVSDAIINFTFAIGNYGWSAWINFGQICQLSFMIFVLATFIPIRKTIKSDKNKR